MATATARRMTEAEYLAIPEEAPYLEFVNGEVLARAMPDRNHMVIIQSIAVAIGLYVRANGGVSGPEGRSRFIGTGGAIDYRLPDYSYWRLGIPDSDGDVLLPPTLAIEVRSPDEPMASQREKCRFYRERGVDVCWLIDPVSRSVEVFEDSLDGEPVAHNGTIQSARLPGFSLPLSELFAAVAG